MVGDGPSPKDHMQIRARVKSHLIHLWFDNEIGTGDDSWTTHSSPFDSLFELNEKGLDSVIQDDPHRDYRYRLFMSREMLDGLLVSINNDITYSNFKPEAKKRTGQAFGFMLTEMWYYLFQQMGDNWKEYNSSKLKDNVKP
jgi:hypothetical protein